MSAGWGGESHYVFILLACPARAGHGSQRPTASLCTPGPKLSFHGAPGDPGVREAGWPQGPRALVPSAKKPQLLW